MIPLVIVAVALLICWCRLAARRLAQRTNARLPVGADGRVPGAESIELRAPDARRGVLLLHGFGDTPQSFTHLARDLHARGYGVMAPLLPGHGRTLRDFAASDATQWLHAARVALAALRAEYQHVGVVGLSMGGALAALLAADDAVLPALVLLAPYLDAPPLLRMVQSLHPVVGILAPYVSGTQGVRSIRDPAERARALAYGATTPRLVSQLVRLADRARAALPRVTAPTLLLQSREDNRVRPRVAERAMDALGATEKRLEWLSGCAHVVTVDYCRDQVAARTGDWLDRYIESPAGLYSLHSRGHSTHT